MEKKELEALRLKINEIDNKMLLLFKERMKVVKGVAEFKIANNMEVLDKSREDCIIKKYTENIENEAEENEIIRFICAMLEISRDAQSMIIEAHSKAHSK